MRISRFLMDFFEDFCSENVKVRVFCRRVRINCKDFNIFSIENVKVRVGWTEKDPKRGQVYTQKESFIASLPYCLKRESYSAEEFAKILK